MSTVQDTAAHRTGPQTPDLSLGPVLDEYYLVLIVEEVVAALAVAAVVAVAAAER